MSLSVEQLKDILLSCLDEDRNVTNMTVAVDTITKLQSVSINREILEDTRLGLIINDIRRKNQETNPQLGKLCRGLIKDWQKLVSPAGAQSSAPERLSTPSGRTITPRQTATARLIVESGLRCSPSPASTPMLQPTTPVMVNGSGQRSGPTSTTVSPESSQPVHRGPAASNSYAPAEQQSVTNGPAQSALKIRIKYGSADQQTSIVREIDTSSPRLSEHTQANNSANANQGAEEAANRRKRKAAPSDQPSRASSLVNNGSKSASPCTSAVPSPGSSVVNTYSPASFPPADSVSIVAPITKMVRKSKSTSPDAGPVPDASANLLGRTKLKSTAELVAEMTSTYPENISISLKNVVPTPSSPNGASMSIQGGTVMASVLAAEGSDISDGEDDSKDEDYRDPGSSSKKAKVVWTAEFIGDRSDSAYRSIDKSELLDRYLQDHSSMGVDGRRRRREKINKQSTAIDSRKSAVIHAPIDWYSAVQLPPVDLSVLEPFIERADAGEECQASSSGQDVCDSKIETVESNAETDVGKLLDCAALRESAEIETNSSQNESNADNVELRSRLLKTTKRGDRQVLAMPYVDIGLPDFVEYDFSNREQYIAHWSER